MMHFALGTMYEKREINYVSGDEETFWHAWRQLRPCCVMCHITCHIVDMMSFVTYVTGVEEERVKRQMSFASHVSSKEGFQSSNRFSINETKGPETCNSVRTRRRTSMQHLHGTYGTYGTFRNLSKPNSNALTCDEMNRSSQPHLRPVYAVAPQHKKSMKLRRVWHSVGNGHMS